MNDVLPTERRLWLQGKGCQARGWDGDGKADPDELRQHQFGMTIGGPGQTTGGTGAQKHPASPLVDFDAKDLDAVDEVSLTLNRRGCLRRQPRDADRSRQRKEHLPSIHVQAPER